MTGMEHAIEQAARIIRDGDPEGMGYAQAHNIASTLASAGLLAHAPLREDALAVEEMGGCVLPTEIGMRAAFEWLAEQEGVRHDWYAEEVPAILAGIDAARRLLAASRPSAVARAEGDGSADCGCADCHTGLFPIMHVCPDCGSKRCPHAIHHANPCNGKDDESGGKAASHE